MATPVEELAAAVRSGDRAALPRAITLVESTRPDHREQAQRLLMELMPEAGNAMHIGITGVPGVGKSTAIEALGMYLIEQGHRVAVLAVDPSSKVSGGSLLGDRVRIQHDPRDDGVLIRSTAAGTRLGGLAEATRDAAQALMAAFDIVVVETVGVGQSETDVAELSDTVAVVVQPGSGDTLQFLKAGIMEVPDVLVVTKADMGDAAMRARRDLAAALRTVGSRETPVVAVSSLPPPTGIEELADALEAHREGSDRDARRVRARRGAALREFTAEHGERALRDLGGRRAAERLLAEQDGGASVTDLLAALEAAR